MVQYLILSLLFLVSLGAPSAWADECLKLLTTPLVRDTMRAMTAGELEKSLVYFENGKIHWNWNHQLVAADASSSEPEAYAYVLGENGDLHLYLESEKDKDHGSVFGARGAAAAGVERISHGDILAVDDASGHYLTPPFFTQQMLQVLDLNKVDLSHIELDLFEGRDKELPNGAQLGPLRALDFIKGFELGDTTRWDYFNRGLASRPGGERRILISLFLISEAYPDLRNAVHFLAIDAVKLKAVRRERLQALIVEIDKRYLKTRTQRSDFQYALIDELKLTTGSEHQFILDCLVSTELTSFAAAELARLESRRD